MRALSALAVQAVVGCVLCGHQGQKQLPGHIEEPPVLQRHHQDKEAPTVPLYWDFQSKVGWYTSNPAPSSVSL